METKKTAFLSRMSLLSLTLTVVLASIDHFFMYGYRAFIAGFVVIALLHVLIFLSLLAKNKVFLFIYGILNALIIFGFGLVNGFWNHAFKMFLTYLHNGGLPPLLSKLFASQQNRGSMYESIGILTFVASIFAAYYGYKFIRGNVMEENHEKPD